MCCDLTKITGYGGPAMPRQRDEGRSHDNFTATQRQADYSLNRLTTVVNGISRLTGKRSFGTIERMLTDLDHATEHRAGRETAYKLRQWRADYLRLTAELDAACGYFHLRARTDPEG